MSEDRIEGVGFAFGMPVAIVGLSSIAAPVRGEGAEG
jgi:hypothetical protein